MNPLGRYIIRARERRGWDRAALARQANVPYTTLRNIEQSKQDVQPSEEILKKLSDALGEDGALKMEMFVQMRVLAGYMTIASKDTTDRDHRLLANLSAHPELRKSLEDMFSRGDKDEIDRAFTALEVTRRLKGHR